MNSARTPGMRATPAHDYQPFRLPVADDSHTDNGVLYRIIGESLRVARVLVFKELCTPDGKAGPRMGL